MFDADWMEPFTGNKKRGSVTEVQLIDCTFGIVNYGLLLFRSEVLGDVVAILRPGSLSGNKSLVAELGQPFPGLKN